MDAIPKYSYLISEIEIEPDENGKSEKSCVVIKEERIDVIEEEAASNAGFGEFASRIENYDFPDFGSIKVEPSSLIEDIGDDREHPGCRNAATEDWREHVFEEPGTSHEFHKVKYKNELNKNQQAIESKQNIKNDHDEPGLGKYCTPKRSEVKLKRSPNLKKEPKKMECQICFRISSRSKLALSRHMTKHRSGKMYICPICGITFPRLSTIIRHRASHTTSKKRKVKYLCRPYSDIIS